MDDSQNFEDQDSVVIDLEEIQETESDKTQRTVFLVIADDSEGFDVALRYASSLARVRNFHVGIIFVLDVDEFQHWGGVETLMREELREQAEKFLRKAARKVFDQYKIKPVYYIRDGNKAEQVKKLIESDPSIRAIVLAAGSGKSGQDHLLAHFFDQGLSKLNVPLLVVPEHLGKED